MNTILTAASLVFSDSYYDAHNRSAALGPSVMKGLEAVVSTTANTTTPVASTIITSLGVAIARTALGTQVLTARETLGTVKQTLVTARTAAIVLESSANTAKDAFTLNQVIFDYNKSKDEAGIVSRPRPPANDRVSRPSTS